MALTGFHIFSFSPYEKIIHIGTVFLSVAHLNGGDGSELHGACFA